MRKKIARTNQAENSEARGVLTDMIRKFCSMNEAPQKLLMLDQESFKTLTCLTFHHFLLMQGEAWPEVIKMKTRKIDTRNNSAQINKIS